MMTLKHNVAIVGASGYSGEELLRILVRHPLVNITVITSRQHAGKAVGEVFPRYAELDLKFSNPDPKEIATQAEIAFLALPHGLAHEIAIPLLNYGIKVIDISADFRLKSIEAYKKYYKTEHPSPELLKKAVYGAPERNREAIASADLIACPGCYPTSIALALIPLLKHHVVSAQNIVISSMSGVTGAGRKVDLPYLFPECNESLRAYGVTGHRHLPEIEQELSQAAQTTVKVNFIPHLVPINRGIHSTIVVPSISSDPIKEAFEAYHHDYLNEPFVRILPSPKLADTKNISMSNRCEIGYQFDSHTGNFIITSCIDNLTKGAAGQAVQCMNIRLQIDETAGLL